MLDVKNLRASYGPVVALRDVSLSVPDGSAVALLGRNGAGKTTTLRSLSGFLGSKDGEVSLQGERIDRRPAADIAKRGVMHVPEGRRIFAEFTLDENLSSGAYCRRLRRGALSEEKDRVLTYFPALTARLRQKAGTLSGGEQQMLAIARALMAAPRLLMIDEPSLGLSPLLSERLYESLGHLCRDTAISVLLVEQYVSLALEITEYAYVMDKGEIVLEGTAEDLRGHPELVSAYVG